MKTNEERNTLRNGFNVLNAMPAKLTGEELEQVMGGIAPGRTYWKNNRRSTGSGTSNDEDSNSEG